MEYTLTGNEIIAFNNILARRAVCVKMLRMTTGWDG